MFRHSGSPRAWVRLTPKPNHLEASVRDAGKGFDSKSVLLRNKPSGVGIQSMRERLRVFGGDVAFESNRRGTTVTATLPVLATIETEGAPRGAIRKAQSDQGRLSLSHKENERILIADDHEVTRKGIRVLLNDQPDLEICGEARNGHEAIEQARELCPDLIIMDLSMPVMGGFAAMKHLRASGLSTKVLIFTTHEYPELERVARAAGCDGFVVKSNASNDLIRGVRAVLDGGKFYSGLEAARAQSASA